MAAGMCAENISTENLLCSTLAGLNLSTKAQLRYNYEWKPTEQVLEECCVPPGVSPEVTNVLSKETVQGFSQKTEQQTPSKLKEEAVEESTLVEKELNASYDDTHVSLFHYEKEKQDELRVKVIRRKKNFDEIFETLHEEKKLYLEEKKEEKMQLFLTSVKAIQDSDRKRSEEARLRQEKLQESHQECAARAVRKVRLVEAWQQKIVEQEEKNKKELQQLETAYQNIELIAHNIQQSLETCHHKSHLSPIVPALFNEMKQVLGLSSSSVRECKETGKSTSVNVKIMQEYSQLMNNIATRAMYAIDEAEAKAVKEQAELQAKMKAEEMIKQHEKLQQSSTATSKDSCTEREKSMLSKDLLQCISESSFKEYSRLEKLLADASKSFEPLISDKSAATKQYKFSLQKAVTTPINAISDQSPAHLLDKIQRLTKLLSGHQVLITGKSLSASSHPLGQVYCRELLAKKIVQQGSQQVSSSPKSAFPIAALAIGVWSAFPDVGDLMLAHFYKACPFLVPFYIPKTEGDGDYYSSLGYECFEGKVESHDKYLKRMSGVVRLYAAIISSAPPKVISQDHPHSVAHGWSWLARVLNLEPRPDYTATALYEFLEVAGHALVKKYKKQFWKLLLVIVKDYVPKIERASSSAQSGPVVRLKGFLEKCIKNQNIQLPEGYLMPHWWNNQLNW